mmetsp:Transcript_92489/g.258545  ORF Transcript_92489/g.258545 Transcript_92489/m.258545 type:complete len:216 (-) Transcript_92489:3-650(-)
MGLDISSHSRMTASMTTSMVAPGKQPDFSLALMRRRSLSSRRGWADAFFSSAGTPANANPAAKAATASDLLSQVISRPIAPWPTTDPSSAGGSVGKHAEAVTSAQPEVAETHPPHAVPQTTSRASATRRRRVRGRSSSSDSSSSYSEVSLVLSVSPACRCSTFSASCAPASLLTWPAASLSSLWLMAAMALRRRPTVDGKPPRSPASFGQVSQMA